MFFPPFDALRLLRVPRARCRAPRRGARVGTFLAVALVAAGCSKAPPSGPAVISDALKAVSTVPSPDAQACAKCHPKEVAAWLTSQHANANRLVDPKLDGDAMPPGRNVHGEAVIGITPLSQYLAPFPGGRLQCVDIARDTRSNEWFYVFNDQRMPHEWGYWTNRSMNWNSQCASCHMTGYGKRYDPAKDTYASTWKAMGVSCDQCHVPVRPVTSDQCSVTGGVQQVSTNSYFQNCASCHARREELTGTFKPGDSFNDHYRLTLPNSPQFHPNGQVNDEDFEYGSFMTSRMAHKGVVCLDCHDPHSGKLKQPFTNNTLCLQCHIPPGLRGATPIDPVKHSGHSFTNSGSLCVECHMPHNTYMVRDSRRDHGMTSPDPLLTKELGIPNSCTPCHLDKTVDWEIDWVNKQYGTNMERRARSRAFVIARARDDDVTVVSNLLAMIATEEIDSWRAALVELADPWSARPDVRAMLVQKLSDTNALVRSAAIHGLQGTPGAYDLIAPLRKDPVRLVRIDAARATLNQLEHEPVSYAELKAYLNATCDQPAGAIRMAQFHMAEGRMDDAVIWARKAADWDPTSAETHSFLGQLLHHENKSTEAEAELRRACELATNSAVHAYTLALAVGEQGRPAEVTALLEKTVALDPNFGRAWYNLGLALAGQEKLEDAGKALMRAEQLLPDSADAPYALATIRARAGDIASARAAALRALKITPDYAPALQLLKTLP